jgi:hypothetical protein
MAFKTSKARDAHQERDVAQPECIKFLNAIGRAEKKRDGVSTICPTCNNPVVAIPHTDVGVADYAGGVRQNESQPLAYVVEVKAGGTVFPMNRIKPEQWGWISEWERELRGVGWFWLMLGVDAVNSRTDFRRITYLVPRASMWAAYVQIMDTTKQSNSTLPMNGKVKRILKTVREKQLFADALFHSFRMEWHTGYGWWPNPQHPWISMYRINSHPPVKESAAYERQLFAE